LETLAVFVAGTFWARDWPSLVVSAVEPNNESLSKGLNSKFGALLGRALDVASIQNYDSLSKEGKQLKLGIVTILV